MPFFNRKINLVLVFVPVVIQSAAFTKPRHVFQYLGENECFQQRLENRPVSRNPYELRAEAFNVFNHTEWLPIYGDAGSGANINSPLTNGYGAANFFQFLGAHNPRILQLGAKFIF